MHDSLSMTAQILRDGLNRGEDPFLVVLEVEQSRQAIGAGSESALLDVFCRHGHNHDGIGLHAAACPCSTLASLALSSLLVSAAICVMAGSMLRLPSRLCSMSPRPS